jgi:hypothetical protein
VDHRSTSVSETPTEGDHHDRTHCRHPRNLEQSQIDAVVAVHPRPDFKRQILQACTDGIKDRPATTFGNVKANVLAHFVPGFVRGDFMETLQNSDWPE